MDWDNVLKDSVKDGKIRALYLGKIPVLKTCDNWKIVEPIGWIDHQMKFTYYKGGIVKLYGKLYFVPEKVVAALNPYINIKFPHRIEVIDE